MYVNSSLLSTVVKYVTLTWRRWVRAALNPLRFFFFFCGSVLEKKTFQSPGRVLVKPSKYTNNVNCRRDMTEIMFKEA